MEYAHIRVGRLLARTRNIYIESMPFSYSVFMVSKTHIVASRKTAKHKSVRLKCSFFKKIYREWLKYSPWCWLEAEVEIRTNKGIHSLKKIHSK